MDSSSQLSDDAFFRYGDGIAEHGGRFLGQPTAHLREEMIDALRYNEMTEKQIAWLTAENERIRASFEVNLAAQADGWEKTKAEVERLKTTCNCHCAPCGHCDEQEA